MNRITTGVNATINISAPPHSLQISMSIRFENHMGGAIPVRRLERVTDIAVRCEGKPLFRDGRTTDVAAQPFQLLAFIGPDRHAACTR